MPALSGSLHDFELADIFQLIGQQKKTGRLMLQDGERQGYAVFLNGSIVSAANGSDSLITYLTNYLTLVKHVPEKKLSEFITHCKGAVGVFADILVRIQYLSEQDVTSIGSLGIEDLACDLFLWKKGQYRFDPMTQVQDYSIKNVSFTIDSIVMEAMRRLDEMKRIGTGILENAVYIPARAPGAFGSQSAAPSGDIARFVLSQLDGRNDVADLCTGLFFSRYRVYEALYQLLQAGTIVALPPQHTAYRKAASQAEVKESKEARETTLSVMITALIIAGIFLMGFLLFPRILIQQKFVDSRAVRTERIYSENERKMRSASLVYQSIELSKAPDSRALKSSNYLAGRDINRW
jgi:hypothetical protein